MRREVLNTRPAEPPFPNGLGRAVLIQVRGRPDGSWQLTIRDDGAEGALVDTVGTHPNRQGEGTEPEPTPVAPPDPPGTPTRWLRQPAWLRQPRELATQEDHRGYFLVAWATVGAALAGVSTRALW